MGISLLSISSVYIVLGFLKSYTSTKHLSMILNTSELHIFILFSTFTKDPEIYMGTCRVGCLFFGQSQHVLDTPAMKPRFADVIFHYVNCRTEKKQSIFPIRHLITSSNRFSF